MVTNCKIEGFVLAEWMVTIALLASLTTAGISALRFLQTIEHRHVLRYLGCELYLERLKAMALDQDIQINAHASELSENSGLQIVTLTSHYHLNPITLGFKASGRTQLAGTLHIESSVKSSSISLSVGNGKLTLKP